MRPRFACIMVSSGLQGVPHGWKLRFVGIPPSLGGEVLGNREGKFRSTTSPSRQLSFSFFPSPPSLLRSFSPSRARPHHRPPGQVAGQRSSQIGLTSFVKNATEMATEREGKITLTSGRLCCLELPSDFPLPPFTSLVSPSLASSPSLAPNHIHRGPCRPLSLNFTSTPL